MTSDQDHSFQEWLAAMQPRLARFEDFLMPVEWRGGYSRESLVALEQYLLDRWPSMEAFIEERDVDFIDGATRYIGEAFLRLAGGGWSVNGDPDSLYPGLPVVSFDREDGITVSPVNLMTALLSRRTGEVLGKMWDGQSRYVAGRRATEGGDWQPERDPVPGIVTQARPASQELVEWVERVPRLVAALRTRAGGRAEALDLSLESLPAVADLVLQTFTVSDLSQDGDSRKDAFIAYVGSVALKAAGGEWVLLVGREGDRNPLLGRPFVERVDSSGERIRVLPEGVVWAVVESGRPEELVEIVRAYAAAGPGPGAGPAVAGR